MDRAVNLACVDLVRDGVFDVLTVPKDDTAEYGYAALDQMAIAKRVRELRLPDRVLVYPGADEVGSVLFARVFNQIKNYRPRIYIRYSSVYGPFIVPRYEDRPLQEGIKAQITSLGGVVLDAPGDSDCMLAVNSPGKHMIESVEQYTKDLTFSTHLNLNELFRYMHYYHEEYGRPVGLAEVSVANGCENDCMELGLLTGTYDYLTAVGGWNTAQNTIGVVLAQLVIASYYNGFCGRPEQLRRSEEFMASRLASCINPMCCTGTLRRLRARWTLMRLGGITGMRWNISGTGCKRFWTRSLRPGYAAAVPLWTRCNSSGTESFTSGCMSGWKKCSAQKVLRKRQIQENDA